MKIFQKILAIFGLSTLVLINNTNVYANIFNDVDQNATSYPSIEKMSKLGIMVGDLQGNFKPDSYISKFDAIKILSKLIKNDKNINISESKYNSIILKYDEKFSRWDSSANTSLAIMLENGILTENNLNNFIILDKNNKEQVRALSNEEIALLLVRIDNKENVVNNMSFQKVFKDESNINPDKVKACYYMDSINIINAKDDNFLPKNAVTKANLAVILDNFLQHSNIELNTLNNSTENLNNNKTIQTRFVTIEKIFIDTNSIQIKIGNETKIYPVEKNAYIYIDDVSYNLVNIKPNSNAEITIQDNVIVKIDVKTNLQIKNVADNNSKKLYGIIKNVSNDSIGLSYKEMDDNGFYSKEKIEIIPLSKNCKITKNGISVKTLKENSLATVILEDKIAKQIILEDDNTLFIGTIIEKSKNKITIKTTDEKIFEIGFLENSQIIRNNKDASINSLKIGDSININVKNDKISKINAKGYRSNKQGVVKSIKINNTSSIIEIEDNENNSHTYYANNLTTDIYSIRILDTVNLYLNSSEIYAIDILERKHNKNFSGEIIDINNNCIKVFTKDLTEKHTTSVLIDKNTTIFDCKNLNIIDANGLKKGDNIYVVLKDTINNIASNINVVSK
ncbi:S-layer homology domain-containing protein [uncultured Tyzzerella sp.]|uniref:S-layer homology domain-containing protein n=1 Tax=uncultured Tyzzerella sp. TaxID=2321398 RepID=UPI002942E618|nr:S-layer homology domain-containing protein [uncultured Tyzzerella sp.]